MPTKKKEKFLMIHIKLLGSVEYQTATSEKLYSYRSTFLPAFSMMAQFLNDLTKFDFTAGFLPDIC